MEYIDYQTFSSRMKSNGHTVHKMDITYPLADTRCWTAQINKGTDNILVTLNVNRYQIGNQYFDILADSRNIVDVYIEDIYDTVNLMIREPLETTYFNDNV
jgi:hypothetical protein